MADDHGHSPDGRIDQSGVQLGSFVLGGRIDEETGARPGVVAALARGAAGAPFEGRRGIARCAPASASGTDAEASKAAWLTAVRQVEHPRLVEILEADVAQGVAFVVESSVDGERLDARLRAGRQLTPAAVSLMVTDVASALASLHAAGLAHQRVTPAAIWCDDAGRATLGGIAPPVASTEATGASDPWAVPAGTTGPAADQHGLALTAATAMLGAPPRFATAARIRDSLPGVPEGVAAVLARGLSPDSEVRYESVGAFASSFAEALAFAGDDLVQGVWEATARNDKAMAAILLEKAQFYAPGHQDLPLLRMRVLGGDPNSGLGIPIPPAVGARTVAVAEPIAPPSMMVDAISSAAADNEAVAALLRMPTYQPAAKPKHSPWLGFALGTLGCVCLLLVLLAVSLSYS